MTNYQIIWPGKRGSLEGRLGPLTQNSTLEPITILAKYADGTDIDLSSYTMVGQFDRNGTAYSITGALTPGNGSFTWQPSAADVGVAGPRDILFGYTDGSDTWYSVLVRVNVEGHESANAVDQVGMEMVPIGGAAWLTDLPNVAGFIMQRTVIDVDETVTIPAGHQMIVAENLQVDGALVADGDLHVI